MKEALSLIICYLIGSIPSGLIIGKLFKNVDIRNYGSGNLGGTNAIRVLGKPLGILVAFMDLMKGGVCILLAKYSFETHIPEIIYGIAAVIGHVFPIFANFRGGKAVATSGGVILFTSPPIFAIGLITFLIVLAITRYVSVASTAVAFMILTSTIIAYIYQKEPFFQPFNVNNLYFVITIVVLFTFVIWRHIPNYKRLIKGTENKVGQKKIEHGK